MKKQEKTKKEDNQQQELCSGRDCPVHGGLKTRGRIFQGIVVKKFDKRAVIVSERSVYIHKYERYLKTRSKLHARIPACLQRHISVGDLIKVRECRPLSRIIHFVAMEVVNKHEGS